MTTKLESPLPPLAILSHELDRTKRRSIDIQSSLGKTIQDQQETLFKLTLQNDALIEKLKQKIQEAETQKKRADAANEELKEFRQITDKKAMLISLRAQEVALKEKEFDNRRFAWVHHLSKAKKGNAWNLLYVAFYPREPITEGYINNPATKELKVVRAEIERLKSELKKHQEELFGVLNQ